MKRHCGYQTTKKGMALCKCGHHHWEHENFMQDTHCQHVNYKTINEGKFCECKKFIRAKKIF